MKKIAFSLAVLAISLFAALAAAPAQAQSTRTWVSGVGDDANPCSRTAPCRTFAGAIAATAVGGEINCLDPGGFGGVVITKALTIDCHEDFGSVLVFGVSGIVVNAPGAVVTLRNVNFDGASSGTVGVNIVAATTVYIEDAVIESFAGAGVSDTRTGGGTKLFVMNSTIRNNGGAGVAAAAAATNSVVIENVRSIGNANGVTVAAGNRVVVSGSVMSGNATAGVEADAAADVFVDNTQIANNGVGVKAAGKVMLGDSDIVFNTTGISGATTSFGNNRLFMNATPGVVPTLGGKVSPEHDQE
jgi:hypothetical protein